MHLSGMFVDIHGCNPDFPIFVVESEMNICRSCSDLARQNVKCLSVAEHRLITLANQYFPPDIYLLLLIMKRY